MQSPALPFTHSQRVTRIFRWMNRRFLTLVGTSSTAMFGGVLFFTAPAAPGHPSAVPTTAAAKTEAASAAAAIAVESSVHYAGCNEVRDLGKAPLYRGQPGYRIGMDGDNDGIACEPHREDDD
ncbi:MAG: excalibur calcium-binding domain-containing protein [Sphingomonas bacterium]